MNRVISTSLFFVSISCLMQLDFNSEIEYIQNNEHGKKMLKDQFLAFRTQTCKFS